MAATPQPRPVDFGLILARLEHLALTGADPEALRQLLSERELLEELDASQLLRWARCAQMAQDRDAAHAALETLHQRFPHDALGWQEHHALLETFGDTPGLMRLRALCQQLAPEHLGIVSRVPKPSPEPQDPPVPEAPFTRQAHMEELIRHYMHIFRGREDCFARQWVDKATGKSGYVPVREPLTPAAVREHLAGLRTYGIYLLTQSGRTYLGVIDADLRKELRGARLDGRERHTVRRELAYLLGRLPELAAEHKLHCITEFSGGKGYHFWFPFAEPVDPAAVRTALGRLAARLQPDLTAFHLEVFPKQDTLSGKGLGNLVKLPLGIHRLSGKPSRLLPGTREDMVRQLERLQGVVLNAASVLESLPPAAPVLPHPAAAAWAEDFPTLHTLTQACPLVAGIVALCRQRRALSLREERVLLGTIGFLPERRQVLHALLGDQENYNPHLVDYKISRLRGTPLGCRKIHALLESTRDLCPAPGPVRYLHPLVFVPGWQPEQTDVSERITNLQDALRELRRAMDLVHRFLPAH